ncbi:uncharacterized protein K02A2.6-like [Ornithodoros turicata]|uniref:uncharacterized protein K02A2.6-like n=1 Tax=Ornithodoros turicata TaxID=34597 RepID=UPI003138AE09
MEQVTAGLDYVACYLDDIIVTGTTLEHHLSNLAKVFQCLSDFGFTLKKEKCAFFKQEVEYLGQIVSKEGFRPSPKKISAILNMPEPRNVSELRALLGMIQHYNRYIPGLADICSPFHELLRKESRWCWSSECVEAFETVKLKLSAPESLAHYDPAKPLFLATDASSEGLGAVIFHRIDGKERPIARASKTLTSAEKKYAQIEREALAIIFGVKKFHEYLWGRRFTLYTDHKPLTTIFGPYKGIPVTTANRLQRWALILMSYSYDIIYKPTTDIGNADGLSRIAVGPDPLFDKLIQEEVNHVDVPPSHLADISFPISADDIAKETASDPLFSRLYRYILEGWPSHVPPDAEPFAARQTELTVLSDCIVWGMRTATPKKFRSKVLDVLHSGHTGQTKMKMLARSYVWWPKIDKDIETLCRTCEECAEFSEQKWPVPLHQWEPPAGPWVRVHCDFAEFKHQHFLITIDAYSKWPEVAYMPTTSASATTTSLQDIFVRQGFPEQLVTDNGPQFTSQTFKDFVTQHGIQHVLTPPYHSKSNGQAENFVRTFKSALRRGGTTKDGIQKFLTQYRVTTHATTAKSPSMLHMGRQIRTGIDLLRPALDTHRLHAATRQKRNYDRSAQDRLFFRLANQFGLLIRWTGDTGLRDS